MICVNSLHLRFNRILMLLVGIWPYERTILVRVQLFLFYGILMTFIIFQLTTFTTTKCTPQFIIDIFCAVSFFIVLMIKFHLFCFDMDAVRQLFEILQHTYDQLTDESEVAIIEKYMITAERITVIFTICAISMQSIIIFLQIELPISDILSSTNKSEIYAELIQTEYFIDQEKYFYLIVLHVNVACFVGGFSMLAGGTMTIMYFQYTYGMFQIASYRIEQAMKINILRTCGTMKANVFYKKMIYAIDIHRSAIGIIEFFMTIINVPYLFLTSVGVISLSLNLFRIFQGISSGCVTAKLIPSFVYIIVIVLYVYMSNDCAQQIMDHNDNLFSTIYNAPWYIAPVYIQKMILFLLQKGTKPFVLNIGGLYVGSLKTAASMMSAAISYFTVLCSVR